MFILATNIIINSQHFCTSQQADDARYCSFKVVWLSKNCRPFARDVNIYYIYIYLICFCTQIPSPISVSIMLLYRHIVYTYVCYGAGMPHSLRVNINIQPLKVWKWFYKSNLNLNTLKHSVPIYMMNELNLIFLCFTFTATAS